MYEYISESCCTLEAPIKDAHSSVLRLLRGFLNGRPRNGTLLRYIVVHGLRMETPTNGLGGWMEGLVCEVDIGR